jgi:molybdopterin molybdotransferase
MTRKLLDDCFLHDRDRLKHAEALAILRARLTPIAGIESVEMTAAAGRILAEPVSAKHPIPAHTNAAVDGYAFAGASYDRAAGSSLAIAGRAAAGHPMANAVPSGGAARIFTGAALPEGTDTVAMQEDCTRDDANNRVHIPGGLKTGANVRKAGADVRAGEALFALGAVLRPQDLAALAAAGLGHVQVFKRLKVATISSGDEIVRPGAPLKRGQVYDANAPMLAGLIAAAGATLSDLGVLPDDAATVRARLADAATNFDVILTSGGASRGDEDHMITAIDALGKRHMWQLAIKPGRPMSFGQIGNTVIVSLPGNPVAAFVCFLLYVWPMLRRLGGAEWHEPRRYKLPATFSFADRKTGRREFWRGILTQSGDTLSVDKFARDGSGLISGLRAADGLIDIPEDVPAIMPGDLVDFIPFSEFGIIGR